MIAQVDAPLLFSITGWVGIGLMIGQITYMLVSRQRAVRDSTDRPFALIIATIGAFIGGTVGWSLSTDGGRVLISLCGALLSALTFALIFLVITPV